MSEALHEDPYDSRRISLWFRSARFCPGIIRQELIQRLEDLWREAKTLEAAFYLSCLYFLEGLEFNNKSDFERSETWPQDNEAAEEELRDGLASLSNVLENDARQRIGELEKQHGDLQKRRL
jgi:hypothetical protein